MSKVQSYNFTKRKLPCTLTQLEKIVEGVLQLHPGLSGIVTLTIVGGERMRSLNRRFRGKDTVTDVLSFSLDSSSESFFSPEQEKVVGELILCPHHIERQARRFKVHFKNELVRMLIHGALHLKGYDHMKKNEAEIMFRLQEHLVVRMYRKVFNERITAYSTTLLAQRSAIYLA